MGEGLRAPEQAVAERHNKIFHFDNFDVVVPMANLSDDIYREIGELTKFIKENEINDIEYCGSQDYERRHFIHPQDSSVEEDYKEDDNNRKTYFIKKRSRVDQETFTNVRQNAKEYGASCIETKNRLNAAASVLNEINIMPEINQILESKDVKELTTKYGLSNISVVEPIFAVNDRVNKEKYLVYPNKSDLIQPYQTEDLRPKINDIKNELGDIFKKNGISPQDYGVGQFMFNEATNTLYLIDTEAWFKSNK